MSIKNTSVQLAVNLVEPYKDVNCLVFELMNVARRYDTTPTATFDFTLPKPVRSIIWKAWVETPCQNVFTELSAKNPNHNDKPAETKDQVIHDAKIQIENMMRRLRVLNVEENILAPELPPRTPAENLSTAVTRAINGERAWPALYKHLSAALREAERLTPVSKLTDDDSGETD